MLFHGDVRTALQAAVTVCYLNPIPSWSTGRRAGVRERRSSYCPPRASSPPFSSRSLSIAVGEVAGEDKKPATCTADELHHVAVPGTEWRLALWRYTPPPEAPSRNHPLVLLSGVGTNAIGFDLSPGASFARHMSSQGFDTWIVEMRGAGLSKRALESNAIEQYSNSSMESDLIESVDKDKEGVLAMKLQSADKTSSQLDLNIPAVNGNKEKSMTSFDELQLVTNLTDTFMRLAERLSGYLNEGQSRVMSAKLLDRISKLLEDTRLAERYNEIRGKISGLLEARQNSAVSSQIRDLSQRLVNIIEEGQRSVSPQLNDLQERLSATIDDFQKQLDLIVTYDWDFDHYLEEDIPAVMEYIKFQSKPKDGRLFAIGHSMGGILLYAMLSRYAFEGKETGMAAVVTLASSLDYTSSKSSLKLLLPLADPAQALSVPVVPLGALLAAAYPLLMRPPYVLSWLSSQISAQDMMHPELFEKLVLNNFCTVPFKLLLQLTTAFREGGLRNRTGTFFYKDHLHKCNVPVLALAGDQDLICPPEAVHETVKLLPEGMATYKVFGDPNGRHYAHYDLVGGRLAIDEVYPCIIEFLGRYDAP